MSHTVDGMLASKLLFVLVVQITDAILSRNFNVALYAQNV